MRRHFVAFTLVALAAAPLAAQGTAATVPPKKMTQDEATVSTLTKLEDGWAVGLVRKDRALFERLLAPKFIYTENDQMVDRATFLKESLGGTDVVTEARNDSMEVHIFGNVGVVTGWLEVKGRGKDGQFDHRYRFTDVWMPRSGTWQIIAAHDYLMPPKK